MPLHGDLPLDDIEDIVTGETETDIRAGNKKHVVPRARKHKTQDRTEQVDADSIIPGTQKIFVKTWGCSHNNSDSEYMAGQLAAFGYNIVDDKKTADLWLLNSCTVKSPAEDHFRNEIKLAKELEKYIVIAGCVPQGQPKGDYMQGLSVVGVQQIDRVVEVVEETLKGHSVRMLGQKKESGKKVGGASLNLPKIRKNPLIEIIAINTGCLNQCTYCKTKHARGELGSYLPEEIVARAKQSFEEGVVEIWLTSEDLGAYGHDIGVTLPQLLWQLVEVIPEGARMRLGMTNPPYILEHLPEIAKILNHPRVYSFLHVPVQSASDSVLMDMKREYCEADFRHVVDFLKEHVPNVTVATDLICGFPTETEADFEETMQLVRDYKFPSLFINQFFPRPGTPAANMPRIPPPEVKKRTKRVSELFQSYHPYTHKLGETQEVLVTEISHDKQYYVGHNKSYDQVLVPKDENLMGKLVTVEITETGKHFMKCRLVKDGEVKRPVSVPPPLPKGQVSGFKQTDVVINSKGIWFFVISMIVMFIAVVWRVYGLVKQFVT
ncbi:threonylcarbamoyladenosine tRNA methylthiotransferase-like [Mercenaria mercenaria]|uniref:threonylcarbamoyladenosine tRNA methylthiotransferase-like n=1 Tax=Mercenaria mercenaria TaxID=6596 RepID=UPI00234EDDBE|nr:threonylcarbamoyladenosine tRNA methylthiotransferase-like [Mercenaria mercenaria]XP_045159403.2 threonylcarbamoyladenosine tRNA methylthiotransferase-like [Mercenaria mercenaria]